MENLKENYRPANIEFDVEGGSIPNHFCMEFKEANEAVEFMAKYVTGLNVKQSVNRLMDSYEKKMIREDYQDLLEQKIPMLERDLSKAKQAFDEAKKEYNNALELVSATTNEAMALAREVKSGVKIMELDDMYTWRVPVGDKYYIYTFMDNQIKLCKVLDIPFYERNELFNAMHENSEFFETYFPSGIMNKEKFEVKEQTGEEATKALKKMVKEGTLKVVQKGE